MPHTNKAQPAPDSHRDSLHLKSERDYQAQSQLQQPWIRHHPQDGRLEGPSPPRVHSSPRTALYSSAGASAVPTPPEARMRMNQQQSGSRNVLIPNTALSQRLQESLHANNYNPARYGLAHPSQQFLSRPSTLLPPVQYSAYARVARNGYPEELSLPYSRMAGPPINSSVMNQGYPPSLAAADLRYRSSPFVNAASMELYQQGIEDERNRIMRSAMLAETAARELPGSYHRAQEPPSAPATSTLSCSRSEAKQSLSGMKRTRDDDTEETGRPNPSLLKTFRLPPYQEGPLPHWSERQVVSAAGQDDEQWLSEYLCFVRKDLLEVFQASNTDIAERANKKSLGYRQVGIRCRFCAHKPYKKRARRSSCFPSTLDRVYQSLSMMLRDHLGQCDEMPEDLKKKFLELKNKNSTGATYSKSYWQIGAMPPGIINTPQGLRVDERFVAHLAAQSDGEERAAS